MSSRRQNLRKRQDFTRDEVNLAKQHELQIALDSSQKKCADTEVEMKAQEENFNAIILELRRENSSLQENLKKEESEKSDAIECHRIETKARISAEILQVSLSEELEKAQQDLAAANQRVTFLDDMNKRLRGYNGGLQQYCGRLYDELEAARESLERVEKRNEALMENFRTLSSSCSSLRHQYSLSIDSQNEALNQNELLHNKVKCLRDALQRERNEVKFHRDLMLLLEEDRNCQIEQVEALSAEVAKNNESSAEMDNLMSKSIVLEETCSAQRQQIYLLEQKLTAANEKLKELKGNIRVFCRVRPLLADDGAETGGPVVSYPTTLETLGQGIELTQSGQSYHFTFDKVFSHGTCQQDVFIEISHLVQSALDGYKVCIFAYGQTGSGKTYTMMGKTGDAEQKGLIPRSLEQIFQTSQSLSAQGWKFKMQASALEIYNDNIRDLLSTNRSTSTESGGEQYTIKHDANGNTTVTDLTIVDVCSIQEVSSLLLQVARSRSVSKTHMNEQSSRSHFVFTLRIFGVHEKTEQQVQGVLNFIDLAESARFTKSGPIDDRLKETLAVNESLWCLSGVISALAKKEDHVPFRNSKLTDLLQPCLSRDSKTLMFVNISPDPISVSESLRSLRFAERVKACELGVPQQQTPTV
ncbi:kinesin-like protein KIN-14D [Mercurialis annua]|uniref:kinesin-like protein KIN-14D n=1 Tax=Mercurialis annua TaxID=3986 RepID=UPI00215DF0C1|nr:kinesin-like protein KIN-14D [Mercurialis annua]